MRKWKPFLTRCTRSLRRLARAITLGFTSWVLVRRKQVPTLGACQKELLSSAEVKVHFGPLASWLRSRVPGDPGEHILRPSVFRYPSTGTRTLIQVA